MRHSIVVGSVFVGALALCGLSWDHKAQAAGGIPDCEDGIDNDGDGLIDYPADPGCSSPDDPSELNTSTDLPQTHFDLSLADLTPNTGSDGGADMRATFPDSSSTTPVTGTGSSGIVTSAGGTPALGEGEDPPRSTGCDVGHGSVPMMPIVLVLGMAMGLAVMRRPHT